MSSDSIVNGVLIGAGIGGATAAGVGLDSNRILKKVDKNNTRSRTNGALLTVLLLAFIGMTLLGGYGIFRRLSNREKTPGNPS